MKKTLILGLGIILIAAACNKTPDATNTNTDTSSRNPNPTPAPAPTPMPNPPPPPPVSSSEVIINMTSTGFSPSTVTVKKDTKVTFKNTDSAPHWPASNPHPTHTDLPSFDSLKGISSGGTYTYTFDKVGKWKFHDHLMAPRGGTVTVVE